MLSAQNVVDGHLSFDGCRTISRESFEVEDRRTKAAAGDILLTIVGSIGRSTVIPEGCPPVTFQRSVAVIKAEGCSPTFLSYQLRGPRFQKLLEANARGTAQKGVYLRTLSALPILLAPTREQGDIAAEIDKQFTRLDAAVAGLQRVKANLKRYRASVLKAACEGRLVPTEAELARREGRSFESGEELLKRVLKERRARWEADQLAMMKAAGKAVRGDVQAAASSPSQSDGVLRDLPGGWAWTSLGQVARIQGGIQKQPSRAPRENHYPFLRVANVARGSLDLSDIHRVELFPGELEKLRLERDDLLIVEGNGSPSEIGRLARWNGSIPDCVHQNHIIRARLALGVLPAFVESYWNSPEGASRLLAVASSTSGLYTLSVSKVSGVPVPLPPLAEQHRIVAEVERRLSVVDELEATVEKNLARCTLLRQSILKMAFEGRLVPQDPNDEPASVLLERIKSARPAGAISATSPSARSPRGRKRAKNP